jgi:hypothetical protein
MAQLMLLAQFLSTGDFFLLVNHTFVSNYFDVVVSLGHPFRWYPRSVAGHVASLDP